MKCRIFKIHLENDSDETNLNGFLENITLHQIFSSIVNAETPFWSVIIFYEDSNASPSTSRRLETNEHFGNQNTFTPEAIKPTAPRKEIAPTDFAPEPVKLTAEQENAYNALRSWRNERAGQDGVPPYLIAHNDSLMQMALMSPKSHEELLQIKGLGEKRVLKYGDEILKILSTIE